VSGPFAHVAGVPVEEILPALAPAWAAMVYITAGFVAWRRRQ
jgi:hypothetical protein